MKIYNTWILKTLFLTIITVFFAQNSISQTTNNHAPLNLRDNIRFGGGIGLGFGNNFFSGTLAPSAIYQFNSQFAAGLGLNFTYASEKDLYSSTIVGGSVLALFSPVYQIQLSAEFEELSVNRNFKSQLPFEDENYWYPALFLGAGYNTGPVTVGVRYDVLYDEYKSIYGSAFVPFVRVYF